MAGQTKGCWCLLRQAATDAGCHQLAMCLALAYLDAPRRGILYGPPREVPCAPASSTVASVAQRLRRHLDDSRRLLLRYGLHDDSGEHTRT